MAEESRTQKLGRHPLTVGTGSSLGTAGLLFLLVQGGVIPSPQEVSGQVSKMERDLDRVEFALDRKVDREELIELKIITNNLVKEAELRAANEQELIRSIRLLVEKVENRR